MTFQKAAGSPPAKRDKLALPGASGTGQPAKGAEKAATWDPRRPLGPPQKELQRFHLADGAPGTYLHYTNREQYDFGKEAYTQAVRIISF